MGELIIENFFNLSACFFGMKNIFQHYNGSERLCTRRLGDLGSSKGVGNKPRLRLGLLTPTPIDFPSIPQTRLVRQTLTSRYSIEIYYFLPLFFSYFQDR